MRMNKIEVWIKVFINDNITKRRCSRNLDNDHAISHFPPREGEQGIVNEKRNIRHMPKIGYLSLGVAIYCH